MSVSGPDIVITGHGGFIGRRLMARYPKARTLVLGVHSLDDPGTLEPLLSAARVVFHLAGVNAGSGFTPPYEQMVRSNILATHGLVEGIKRYAAGVPLVILLSSIHVYRKSGSYREDGATGPASFYGFTKLSQEVLLREAAGAGIVEALILRASNVYGPGCRPNYNSAVATFCQRIRDGMPIELTGGGRSQADLIYVDDTVDIMTRYAELRRPREAIYNLATGRSVGMSAVVAALARISGCEPAVQLVEGQPQVFTVENSRLLAALGGYAFTELERGLAATYEPERGPAGSPMREAGPDER